jgi:hypothetical protein
LLSGGRGQRLELRDDFGRQVHKREAVPLHALEIEKIDVLLDLRKGSASRRGVKENVGA